MRSSRPIALVAVAALFVSGCADDRVPLEDCDYGLYWAECGGNGEAVLGCDRGTGDCRWFAGGLTARGHAVSTCPPTNPCCHSNWPFTDFSPDGTVREVAVEQMSLLGRGVVQRREPYNDLSVTFDLTGIPPGGIIEHCDGVGCSRAAGGPRLAVGDSVVVYYGSDLDRWLLEIIPGETAEDWSAHVYRFQAVTREGLTPPLACSDWYSASSSFALVGVLHLNTSDLSDPEAVHGHLIATGDPFDFDIVF
jgi:hypothetical protein